jgi:hypothetical protein
MAGRVRATHGVMWVSQVDLHFIHFVHLAPTLRKWEFYGRPFTSFTSFTRIRVNQVNEVKGHAESLARAGSEPGERSERSEGRF